MNMDTQWFKQMKVLQHVQISSFSFVKSIIKKVISKSPEKSVRKNINIDFFSIDNKKKCFWAPKEQIGMIPEGSHDT